MKIIFLNFFKVFKSLYWIIGFIIWFLLIWLPTYLLTYHDTHNMRMWMWDTHYFFMVWLDIFLAILFGIFIWATIYKMKYFWNNKWTSKLWVVGWFIWTVVWGCASCSITVATYIWLASFLSIFPYGWLELKVLSIFLLIYATYTTLKNLEVCNLKLKRA